VKAQARRGDGVQLSEPWSAKQLASAQGFMVISVLLRLTKGSLDVFLTWLGTLFYYCGLARAVIRIRHRAPRVLMYHACEERESDFTRGLSINTTPARLAAQLDFLRKYYQIVPLSALAREPVPDRAVVITFDDGFRSVFERAFPQLRARNLPATCFLTTDVLERRGIIWLNELNWFVERHRAVVIQVFSRRFGRKPRFTRGGFIQKVIEEYDRETIRDLLAELRIRTGTRPESLVESPLYLDHEQIEEMSRNGFTFGNHTASHAVLSRLSDRECRDEILRGGVVLDSLPGSTRSLAYPFGLFTDSTRRIARELGYTMLMEVEGGNDPWDRSHVGRVNVTSISPAALFAKMEMSAPIKFRIKQFLRNRLGWRGGGQTRSQRGPDPVKS
jgi:peptidoglycan/xylan/chitin deacetylase (PgdA/CDA1 family)